MTSSGDINRLPGVAAKLNAPRKKSEFERNKEAAEAKKRQNEIEARGLYGDFAEAMDYDSEEDRRTSKRSRGSWDLFSDAPKRQKSDPTEFSDWKDRRSIVLTNLPPQTRKVAVEGLLNRTNLKVDEIRMLDVDAPRTARLSKAALAIMAAGVDEEVIREAIKPLQNGYLGFGYYLSISAQSKVRVGDLTKPYRVSNSSLPHGATKIEDCPPQIQEALGYSSSSASSYSRPTASFRDVVIVRPPTKMAPLRLIMKTVTHVVAGGEPAEAALKRMPEVQFESKWAFLWDPRCPDGIYYQYRLWEFRSGRIYEMPKQTYGTLRFHQVVQGHHQPLWCEPPDIAFEFCENLEEMIAHPHYKSDDSDDEDEDIGLRQRRLESSNNLYMPPEYLNPLERAKFAWLLRRLPDDPAKLTKGDAMSVTAFAFEHAHARDEVVDMVIKNALRPFSTMAATAQVNASATSPNQHDVSAEHDAKKTEFRHKVVSLLIINDIIGASQQTGITAVYRYPSLFEVKLPQSKVFSRLGRIRREVGHLSANRLRTMVIRLLEVWHEWNSFSPQALKDMNDQFENPPLTTAERTEQKAADKKAAERRVAEQQKEREKQLGHWKKVGSPTASARGPATTSPDNGRASAEELRQSAFASALTTANEAADDIEMQHNTPIDGSSVKLSVKAASIDTRMGSIVQSGVFSSDDEE